VGPGALWKLSASVYLVVSLGRGTRAAPVGRRVRHIRGQTSLNSPCFYGRPTILSAEAEENQMSEKDRHQRRRRWLSRGWQFKLIVGVGQAAYYVVRFWLWMSDRG